MGERTIGQRDCGSVETDRRQRGCRIANENLSSVGETAVRHGLATLDF